MVVAVPAVAAAGTTAAAAGTAATAATVTSAAMATAAAATPVVTAGGVAAASATAGLSVSSILSGGLTLFSAVGGLLGMQQQAAAAKSAARFSDFQARNEIIKGKQESAAIRMKLARTIAAQSAGGAVGGVDPFTGSGYTVMAASSRAAHDDIEGAALNAATAAAAFRQQGMQHRMSARAARFLGFGRAASSLFDFHTRQMALGAP